jgi:hypothetical protein
LKHLGLFDNCDSREWHWRDELKRLLRRTGATDIVEKGEHRVSIEGDWRTRQKRFRNIIASASIKRSKLVEINAE